jgi:hypothetical protein
MKKLLVIITAVALALSACSQTPAEIAAEKEAKIKQAQEQLEYDKETKFMESTRKAVFKEEAVFQENCKVGYMYWIDGSGQRDGVKAVVCDGLPTRSLQYTVPSGKYRRVVNEIQVAEPVDHVAEAKKILEEDQRRKDVEAKQKALDKLSDEEKKILGL